jgi:hypothetical protein
MTARTTTTRRRQRRHSADELAAMPDKTHAHVALDRCPGLPGIQMNGAHVFRHDADGETLCTRCDLALPPGLCLACGATLYVSGGFGDLRDASNGDARCPGRLMPAADQPSHPYAGTAHVLRADDPLMASVKPLATIKSGKDKGKTPSTPDRDERRPNGIVCATCRRLVYVGEGHAADCSYKARSIAYNAELHERLLAADALADAERAQRAERREAKAAADDASGEAKPRRRRGTLADADVCAGSDTPAEGEITTSRAGTATRVARCHVCARSIPLREDGTLRRHKPGKGRTPKDVTTPPPTPALDTPKAKGKAKAPKSTPAPARKALARKTNGRSALSAKATVHALTKGAPACGATIANISKTADAVTCKTCATRTA